MMIRSVVFQKSVTRFRDCPVTRQPEVAFIGRSNVGKSSLINFLFQRKKMAKTSVTPGKTQTMNFYLINNSWYAVDLPGYGWARVSKDKKQDWSGFVREYLLRRENLGCLMVLLDIRHEPQAMDLDFLNWSVKNQIPIALVFTKADKISKNKMIQSVELYKRTLLQHWSYLPEIFITSVIDKRGREEIIQFLTAINPI
jgi:GTP-binding protein